MAIAAYINLLRDVERLYLDTTSRRGEVNFIPSEHFTANAILALTSKR